MHSIAVNLINILGNERQGPIREDQQCSPKNEIGFLEI